MNAAKLIKLSPMLVMIAFLAYAGYSMHSSAVDPDAGPSNLAKDVDNLVEELRAVGTSIANVPGGGLRDPFRIVAKPADKAGASDTKDDEPDEPVTDTLADVVQAMRLDGTYVQGKQQFAIIDGRVYSLGQHLAGDGDPTRPVSKLFLVGVQPGKAILHADGRNYTLGYADRIASAFDKTRAPAAESPQQSMAEIDAGGQMAMFKKLLNSPLGALGKAALGRSSGKRPRRKRPGE
jgi:hypothetical protein